LLCLEQEKRLSDTPSAYHHSEKGMLSRFFPVPAQYLYLLFPIIKLHNVTAVKLMCVKQTVQRYNILSSKSPNLKQKHTFGGFKGKKLKSKTD
jgi:hypothetical protein